MYCYCVFIILHFINCRSTASWPLEPLSEEKQGWRYVRIQQNGKNASGQTHYLSLSGFEIYGTVTGVCNDLGQLVFFVLFYSSFVIKLSYGVICQWLPV